MNAVGSTMPELTGPLRRSLLKARLVAREVRALSPATMRAITENSLRMARQERKDRAVENLPATPITAGKMLTGVAREEGNLVSGVTAVFERAHVDVDFFSNDVVRISWGPDDEPVPWATEPAFDLPPLGQIDVSVTEELVVARSLTLRVEIEANGIKIYDADARLRYQELAPLRRGPARVHRRLLRHHEQLLGFGEQAGPMDRRGRTLRFWNRDPGGAWGKNEDALYCSIPVSIGRHQDGPVLAFHENSFDATATIEAPNEAGPSEVEIRFVGGMVRSWIVIGDEPTLLRRYAGITGKAPMPPRWALGYHHSRWGYKSSDELVDVLHGFSQHGIPISALHMDIDYMDAFKVFTFDEENFSNVDRLATFAATRGTRLVAIVDPALRRDPEFDLYKEAIEGDHVVRNEDGSVCEGTVWPGWAVFPDFSKAATRTWWSGHYKRLLDNGISGIWHDMNEPTSITLNGDRTLPRSSRHDNNGRGGDHREVHNVYGMLMNRSGREALLRLRPEKRPFLFSRSGWAGMQRHAWNWTGDVEASKEGLVQQLATFLGLALSGVPFTGSDVGGFSGSPSPTLYLRWLELGVVSAFFRTHSVLGAPAREPWAWPETYQESIANLIALRYRLLPYLYTSVEKTVSDGSLFLAPVWWGGRDEVSGTPEVTSSMMVGASLLYCVATGGDNEMVSVGLPEGLWWRWSAIPGMNQSSCDQVERVAGGTHEEFAVPLGQPLFFIRGGSILPLDDAWRYPSRPAGGLRGDHAPERLTFHIFPGEDAGAKGEHFDDDGDGDGPTRRDILVLADDVLSWNSEGDRVRPATIELVVHGRVLHGAIADGIPLASGALTTDGASTTLRLDAFKRLKLI